MPHGTAIELSVTTASGQNDRVSTPISLPSDLLPRDGRFGCGPSRVRPEAVAALADAAPSFLGTSHRQPTVKNVVGSLRAGIAQLFSLPDGWEVVLGNGGTTTFWDAATFALIDQRSLHLTFGEFSSKFASCAQSAPFLAEPVVVSSPVGSRPQISADPSVDLYALTHNETSTGVAMTPVRPTGATEGQLVAVDATSAAGGLRWHPAEVDVYYFAPQKCLASDGGLWLACCSPAAIERIERISAGDRWIPQSIDLGVAVENSRLDQTLNTPALTTLFLADWQVRWMNEQGGLAWAAARCDASARTMYDWAEASAFATPFVREPEDRSHVVATIDFAEGVDAAAVAKTLRANGIVDVEPYRKLGRNQLRVAMFPAIDPADIEALTRCVDYVIERLA